MAEKQNVKVVVRVRPFLAHEDRNSRCVFSPEGNLILLKDSHQEQITQYSFDTVYSEKSQQPDLFTREIAPVLPNLLCGHNITVLAFGITGTGKTHTMQGTKADPGIVPLALRRLLDLRDRVEHESTVRCSACDSSKNFQNLRGRKIRLSLSFLEVYHDEVYDLLETKAATTSVSLPGGSSHDNNKVVRGLPVREDANGNVVIQNSVEVFFDSCEEFGRLYERGCQQRASAATQLNAHSSRSHAIIMVRCYVDTGSKRKLLGKLHLIDLAGNEDNRKTGNVGQRLVESSAINKSLFVLGKVINSLNAGHQRIPYRDSKLTRLLQDSLGGRNYCIMIVTIAPGTQFYQHTSNTLSYATKSRAIVNCPDKAESLSDEEVLQCTAPANEQMAHKLEEWKKSKRPTTAPPVDNGKHALKVNHESVRSRDGTHSTSSSSAAMERVAQHIEHKVTKELEKRIEERTQEMSKKLALLSPFVRKHRVYDDETLVRLERLEAQLIKHKNVDSEELTNKGTKTTLESQRLSKRSEIVDKDTLARMSPTSKLNSAKALIIDGKEEEKKGELQNALTCFQLAQSCLPNNNKLNQRIASLRERIDSNIGSDPMNTSSGASSLVKRKAVADPSSEDRIKSKKRPVTVSVEEETSKENVDPKMVFLAQVNSEVKGLLEKELLDTLNEGSLKRLMALKTIGEKRALAILEHRQTNAVFRNLSDLSAVGMSSKQISNFLKSNAMERMAFV
eukprot:GILK01010422.1.p1 GENE.GILK01010422.1~~GILK01010422.1.p1  ORF type:complete len:746 (+),score=122.48 GILK01010422.1:40-2238(+)